MKFTGIRVEIKTLHSSLIGTVQNVNDISGLLTLTDVELQHGQVSRKVNELQVSKGEIIDIKVSNKQPIIEKASPKKEEKLDFIDPAIISYSKSNSPNRSKKATANTSKWNDVSAFSQDFDFEKNLSKFDKEKEFAELRLKDKTNPEHLLVNFNLRKRIDNPKERVIEKTQMDKSQIEFIISCENASRSVLEKVLKFMKPGSVMIKAKDGQNPLIVASGISLARHLLNHSFTVAFDEIPVNSFDSLTRFIQNRLTMPTFREEYVFDVSQNAIIFNKIVLFKFPNIECDQRCIENYVIDIGMQSDLFTTTFLNQIN